MSFRRRAFGSIVSCAVLAGIPNAHALEIEEASIADIEAAYRDGELTAHQVVAAYLARIDAYDKQGPYINSIINLNPKALEEADKLDAVLKATGKPVGPLHGIPVLIKDCIDAQGMPMTAGFQGWKNYYPPSDAPLVARIKAAGGIILGKASLSEFTNGGGDNINSVLPGFARNPYNPDPKGGVTGLGSSLTFVGSTLQWPALTVPNGYLGQGLPVGLQILGRAWDEAKIIGYAYSYEQATHYRRPPPSVPPLGPLAKSD